MKIVFLGTPEFAINSLNALFKAGHDILVITPVDKPFGRGHRLLPCPVKSRALELGLSVFQTERVRNDDAVSIIESFAPDLMVTAAFGQMLSQQNLKIPKLGCINVHASLLPKYRGAAPINFAIINGETVTGVTIMMTDIGLDTGDILLKEAITVGENETALQLSDRLSILGARLLIEATEKIEGGNIERIKQNEAEATKCGMITKDMTHIDFSLSSLRVHNFIRGLSPIPSAYAEIFSEPVKIFSTRIVKESDVLDEAKGNCFGKCFIASGKRGLFVKTGDGAIEITELQFKNGRPMDARSLLNGKKLYNEVFK
ncbi:MAG: methionyl-tRNA formyltransferase [Clostridia bacterium]